MVMRMLNLLGWKYNMIEVKLSYEAYMRLYKNVIVPLWSNDSPTNPSYCTFWWAKAYSNKENVI